MTTQAILLPGAVMPAELAYGALLAALGDDVHAVAKDLEIYADAGPRRVHAPARDRRHPADRGRSRLRPLSPRRLLGRRRREPGVCRRAPRAAAEPRADRARLDGKRRAQRRGTRDLARVRPHRRPAARADAARVRRQPARHRRRAAAATARPTATVDGQPPGRGCAPSSRPSALGASISTGCARSTSPSSSRSAARATPTTTAGWPTVRPRSSPTSRSRSSRSATTSTLRTGSSPSARRRCSASTGSEALPTAERARRGWWPQDLRGPASSSCDKPSRRPGLIARPAGRCAARRSRAGLLDHGVGSASRRPPCGGSARWRGRRGPSRW